LVIDALGVQISLTRCGAVGVHFVWRLW
jgi:hypothetical protein